MMRPVIAWVAVVLATALGLGGALLGEGKAPTTAPAASAPAEAGFISLFSGKDLTGWKPTGEAQWLVESACLVGTQDTGKGGDLFTDKEFDNFELRVTYRVKWPANSGFWFRYGKGGYQFDVLKWKNPVGFSGTLYCPAKMFITTNLDESIENRDGWNEARIWANGDHIILWLNGKRVGECRDKTHAKGRFGIQVHGGNEFKGMKVHVRKFAVRPLVAGEKPPVDEPATQPASAPATAPAAK